MQPYLERQGKVVMLKIRAFALFFMTFAPRLHRLRYYQTFTSIAFALFTVQTLKNINIYII